jgi:hypothetical protein
MMQIRQQTRYGTCLSKRRSITLMLGNRSTNGFGAATNVESQETCWLVSPSNASSSRAIITVVYIAQHISYKQNVQWTLFQTQYLPLP